MWLRLRGHAGLLNQDRAPPTLAIFKMSRQSRGAWSVPHVAPTVMCLHQGDGRLHGNLGWPTPLGGAGLMPALAGIQQVLN